jgi:hypothetical protein
VVPELEGVSVVEPAEVVEPTAGFASDLSPTDTDWEHPIKQHATAITTGQQKAPEICDAPCIQSPSFGFWNLVLYSSFAQYVGDFGR